MGDTPNPPRLLRKDVHEKSRFQRVSVPTQPTTETGNTGKIIPTVPYVFAAQRQADQNAERFRFASRRLIKDRFPDATGDQLYDELILNYHEDVTFGMYVEENDLLALVEHGTLDAVPLKFQIPLDFGDTVHHGIAGINYERPSPSVIFKPERVKYRSIFLPEAPWDYQNEELYSLELTTWNTAADLYLMNELKYGQTALDMLIVGEITREDVSHVVLGSRLAFLKSKLVGAGINVSLYDRKEIQP